IALDIGAPACPWKEVIRKTGRSPRKICLWYRLWTLTKLRRGISAAWGSNCLCSPSSSWPDLNARPQQLASPSPDFLTVNTFPR
ncbi:hypothetical protein STEG23_031565, partial [Scotinomys teguina]